MDDLDISAISARMQGNEAENYVDVLINEDIPTLIQALMDARNQRDAYHRILHAAASDAGGRLEVSPHAFRDAPTPLVDIEIQGGEDGSVAVVCP